MTTITGTRRPSLRSDVMGYFTMRISGVLALFVAIAGAAPQLPADMSKPGRGDQPPVPYPEGFRSWTVVKSLIVGPDHDSFAKRGGIHHYYANDKAVAGYRTGTFPDGSIVVDE